jgi:hypothetical protein
MKKTKKIKSQTFTNMLTNIINGNGNLKTLLLSHLTGNEEFSQFLEQPNAYARLVFPEGFTIELGMAEDQNGQQAVQEAAQEVVDVEQG